MPTASHLKEIFEQEAPSIHIPYLLSLTPQEYHDALRYLEECPDEATNGDIAFQLTNILLPHFSAILNVATPWWFNNLSAVLGVNDDTLKVFFLSNAYSNSSAVKLGKSFAFCAWQKAMNELNMLSARLDIGDITENPGLWERRILGWELITLMHSLSEKNLRLSVTSFQNRTTLLNISSSIKVLFNHDAKLQNSPQLLTQDKINLIEQGLDNGTSQVIEFLSESQLLNEDNLVLLFSQPYTVLMTEIIRECLWDRLVSEITANNSNYTSIWVQLLGFCDSDHPMAELQNFANTLLGRTPTVSYPDDSSNNFTFTNNVMALHPPANNNGSQQTVADNADNQDPDLVATTVVYDIHR